MKRSNSCHGSEQRSNAQCSLQNEINVETALSQFETIEN